MSTNFRIPPGVNSSNLDNQTPTATDVKHSPYILFMEIVPNEVIPKLPDMFSRAYRNKIPAEVIFQDPKRNIHKLTTIVKDNNTFFGEGWTLFRSFYGVENGGWLHMVFDGVRRFSIRVINPKGKEISYPHSPISNEVNSGSKIAYTFTKSSVVAGPVPRFQESSASIPNHIVDIKRFKDILVKWVKFEELYEDKMTIPITWAHANLPAEDTNIIITDENGKTTTLRLEYSTVFNEYSKENTPISFLTKGWSSFCRLKGLKQHQVIRFGVLRKVTRILYYH